MTTYELTMQLGVRAAAKLMILRSRYLDSVCPDDLDGGSQYPELIPCWRHHATYCRPCEAARIASLARDGE